MAFFLLAVLWPDYLATGQVPRSKGPPAEGVEAAVAMTFYTLALGVVGVSAIVLDLFPGLTPTRRKPPSPESKGETKSLE